MEGQPVQAVPHLLPNDSRDRTSRRAVANLYSQLKKMNGWIIKLFHLLKLQITFSSPFSAVACLEAH